MSYAAVVEAFCDPEIQRWHARRADSISHSTAWCDTRTSSRTRTTTVCRAGAAQRSAPPLKNGETIHAGWLHTGDLVQLSDDGAMKLVDRLKDVIITGGRNV
jgi:acyl-CoA synthetase (AMP-forming)/AMP-acid ligase II